MQYLTLPRANAASSCRCRFDDTGPAVTIQRLFLAEAGMRLPGRVAERKGTGEGEEEEEGWEESRRPRAVK